MKKRLFSTRFIDSLDRFFTETCKIQEKETSQSDSGEPEIDSWTDVYSVINCAIGKKEQKEARGETMTITTVTHRIILQGYYPDITSEMRAQVNNVNYNIQGVEPDYMLQKTSLSVEKVTT